MKPSTELWAVKRKADNKVWQDLTEREFQILVLGCIRFEKDQWLVARKSDLTWTHIDKVVDIKQWQNEFQNHQGTPPLPEAPPKPQPQAAAAPKLKK